MERLHPSDRDFFDDAILMVEIGHPEAHGVVNRNAAAAVGVGALAMDLDFVVEEVGFGQRSLGVGGNAPDFAMGDFAGGQGCHNAVGKS